MRFASTRQVFNAASPDLADQADHDDRGQREGIEAIAVETRPDRTVNPRDLWTGQPTRRTFLGGMFAAVGAGAVIPPVAAVVEQASPLRHLYDRMLAAADEQNWICKEGPFYGITDESEDQEERLRQARGRECEARDELIRAIASRADYRFPVPTQVDLDCNVGLAAIREGRYLFTLAIDDGPDMTPESWEAISLPKRIHLVRVVVLDMGMTS